MIQKEKCIVVDIDGTLCPIKQEGESYKDLKPHRKILEKIKEYKQKGFTIILYTARNMRTYEGNVGRIMAHTAKVTTEWLDKHDIPYDEIHFGKPWQGRGGFYVDDKTIRPQEFLTLEYEEILKIVGKANHD